MVLADSLFHKMSHGQWEAATRPKVQGKQQARHVPRSPSTWELPWLTVCVRVRVTGSRNLHELLPDDVDFFVVLSSLAGIIGSVLQGNYAAGNALQDALVHYRRSKGLAAQGLDLGVMRGFGYVEEHQDVGARMNTFKLVSGCLPTLPCPPSSLDGESLLSLALTHKDRPASASGSSSTSSGAPSPAPQTARCPLPSQLLIGAGSGGVLRASRGGEPGRRLLLAADPRAHRRRRRQDCRLVAARARGGQGPGRRRRVEDGNIARGGCFLASSLFVYGVWDTCIAA